MSESALENNNEAKNSSEFRVKLAGISLLLLAGFEITRG
jgi:hypothetical protein